MKLVGLLPFILSGLVYGQPSNWHDHLNGFADKIEDERGIFPSHGFNSTLWAAIQAYRIYDLTNKEFPEVAIESASFAKKSIRVGLKIQPVKKPLIVVMSGFGANLDTTLTRRSTYFFTSRGYHVLTVPNPWSTDFINAKPRERPGSLFFEAKTILDLIQKAKQKIGLESIESTEIYAESYGAFLSTVLLSLDKNKLVDSHINLISPPFNIRQAFVNLDELLDMYHGEWKEICAGPLNSLHIARDNGLYNQASEMTNFSVKCAPSLMIEKGFYEPLWSSVYAVDKVFKLKKSPYWIWQHGAFKSKLRFKDVFPEYLPEATELLKNRDFHKMSYWLSLASKETREKIHITYSTNDFLNRGLGKSTKTSLESLLSPEQLTELSWGGHMGYLSLPKWEKTLDEIYGPTSSLYVYQLKFRWFGLD